mmetsp:Transcript_21912/g.43430  ORF Transcript_21912/g.43430 Transcript_21912/m.43430 type:complete len:711 (-) Transcript_21912:314-2446(-)
MIEYFRGPYGANLLLRWHGSALAKAFLPGLLSVILYLSIHYSRSRPPSSSLHTPEFENDDLLNHPYAIGVLVSSVSFLIIFRANYGYQRYWEACSMTHALMSKWIDAACYSAVFHLQSRHYDGARPPSFFGWDELNGRGLTRDREVLPLERRRGKGTGDGKEANERGLLSEERSATDLDSGANTSASASHRQSLQAESSVRTLRHRRYTKSINETQFTIHSHYHSPDDPHPHATNESLPPHHLLGPPRLDGGWGKLHPRGSLPTATYYPIRIHPDASAISPPSPRGFASTSGGRTPSLFLQELAHLSSLLLAVALATLRDDDLDDSSDSFLGVHVPGAPFPPPDPHSLPLPPSAALSRNLRYLLGMDPAPRSRALRDASRPLPVLGGVSDNELAFLRRARGPHAKVQLAWSWLSDFIMREHLAGSLGPVGPPIVSRVVQYLGDGMLYYNHARKIVFVPFPFPHAQLSACFVFVAAVALPLLMEQYTNEAWLGASLSFLTVACLAGLHEVARELENPFRNAPNDVPLRTLLAMGNEALVTMYAGWHPDSFWEESGVCRRVLEERTRRKREEGESGGDEKKDGESGEEEKDGDGNAPDFSDETATTLADDDKSEEPTTPIDDNDEDDDDNNYNENERRVEQMIRAVEDRQRQLTVPQSGSMDEDAEMVEADPLQHLRDMIKRQAVKIRELQERMQLKDSRRRMKLEELVASP